MLASKRFDGQGRGHWGWDRDPLKDVSFYHHDVLGSVVMLADTNGKVEERYQYDVWGKVYDGKFADGSPGCGNGQNGNVYGFTGQRFQPEIGVYSFPYRDYSPRTMRWLNEDPLKDGMNWYQYCYGNPVNYIDPAGLWIESAWDAISLGIGVASFVENVQKGNVGGALVDAAGIVLDTAALVAPIVPGGVSAGIKAVRTADKIADATKAAKTVDKAADVAETAKTVDDVTDASKMAKQPGSYTIEFESGKKYHGKGPQERAEQSAREKAKEYNDPVKDIDWTPSKNNREAYKDEYKRLEKDGGPRNPDNYNKVESPGKKYTEQDAKKP